MLNADNDGRGFTMISLELLSEENSLDVYSFEKENREYFERNLPPRPANYFDLEGFKEITRNLLTEQDNHDTKSLHGKNHSPYTFLSIFSKTSKS